MRPHERVARGTTSFLPCAVILGLAGLGQLRPTALAGQGLGRSPGGEVGFSFQALRRATGASPAVTDATYRQWLKLPFRGSLLDPRLLGFDVTLNPGFTQRTSPGLPEALMTQELNFGYSVRILPSKPLSLTLTSNRATGSTSGGFGADGEFETRNMIAVTRFTNRLLPMEVRYTRLARENTWISGVGLAPIQWANESRTLRFDARNRKTMIRLDRMEFDDLLGESGFTSFDAALDHRLRWGKGSELQSSWDANTRSGALESRRRTWRERLHIQHTETASSDLRLQRTMLETPRGARETDNYGGSLRMRPWRWLTLGGQASSRVTRFNGSSDEARGGGPNASISMRTPGDGRLIASGAFGFERRTRVGIEGGIVDVIDESHAVDETRSFLLEHPRVEPGSIVVRSAEDGLIYTAGVEFRIVTIGELTEIIIFPGTRILEGAALLVDYRYRLPELPSGDLLTGRYSVALSVAGVSVQHSRSVRDGRDANGDDLEGLSTFDETQTGLSIDWGTPIGRFDLDGRLRDREGTAHSFQTAELSSSLALPYWRGLQFSVGASARRSRDRSGELAAKSAYGSLLWSLHPRAQLAGRVQYLALELAQGVGDRTVGGNLDLTFTAARLEGSIRLEYDRRIEPRAYSGGRLYVRLARRL